MAEEERRRRGAALDVFGWHLLALAEDLVGAVDEEPEQIHAGVPLAGEEAGFGVIGGEQWTGGEQVDLIAGVHEVERQVVDPGERHRVVERLVPEHAADDEQPVGVHLRLDHAIARLVAAQVAQPLVGVAHHGVIGVPRRLAVGGERGVVDAQLRELGLDLERQGGVEQRQELLPDDSHRQHETLARPRRRLAGGVDRRVERGLFVGEHVALEPELDRAGTHSRIELAVDPHRALVEVAAGGRGDGLEVDDPGVATVDGRGAAQAVLVLLGEQDLERQRGCLLRLDQGQLGQPLRSPLDAVDHEAPTTPSRSLRRASRRSRRSRRPRSMPARPDSGCA